MLILSTIFSISILLPTHTVFATDDICNVSNVSDEIKAASGCEGYDTGSDLGNTIINIINVVISVIGIVAVIAIIIGGVQYMTSTGDPGKIKKAKDTIMYAVIGLIIVILAAVIVNFVITSII